MACELYPNKTGIKRGFQIKSDYLYTVVLPNQTWGHSPEFSKASSLTWDCGEGESASIAMFIISSRQLVLKRHEPHGSFHGEAFKDKVGVGGGWLTGCLISSWTFF